MPYPDTWKAEAEKRVSSFLACRRSWVQAMNMKTRNMKKEDKRKKRKNVKSNGFGSFRTAGASE